MILSVISLLYLCDGMILDYITPLFCCASQEFSASLKIIKSLCNLILRHDLLEVKAIQLCQKSSVQSPKQEYYSKSSADLRQLLSSSF